MARTDTLGHFLTDVADAIRTKTGSSNTIAAEDFDTEIENIPSGGGAIKESDVNFYDYDGTLTNSYTKSDFLALSEMPGNPTHSGLTSQGWNWSLADAKTYMTNYNKLDIGQMYDTDDGSVRIYIELQDGRVSPYLGIAVDGTVTVDWGDNSTDDTITGTSSTTPIFTLHNYTQPGEYVITISDSDDVFIVGSSDTGTYLLTAGGSTSSDNRNGAYQSSVKSVVGVKNIDNHGFRSCRRLSTVIISSTVTSIGNNAFRSCPGLQAVTLPNKITIVSDDAFHYCANLSTVSIPYGVTSIGSYCFQSCIFRRITIPHSVTTFGVYAFEGCSKLKDLEIPNSVSTINNNCFRNCSNLVDIQLSSGLTSIESNCFQSCSSLSHLTIPSSMVGSIGNSAFASCSSLVNVIFNGTIGSIGSSVFTSGSSIAYYDFSKHTSIPILNNSNSFDYNASDYKIIVPDALYETWITSGQWAVSSVVGHIIKKSQWDNQ